MMVSPNGNLSSRQPTAARDRSVTAHVFAASAAIAASAVLLALLSTTTVDPDLWGHVLYGIDILRQKTVVSVDPYSFTSDQPWINHEWLSELSMGLAFRSAGTPGLMGLKVGLIAFTAWLAYATARLRSDRPTAVGLTLALLVSIFPLSQTIRPQLFSLAGFALMLALVGRYWALKQMSALIAIPAVMWVWANCHGGWVLGEATLWLLLGPCLLRASKREAIAVVLVIVTSAATPLINPYGPGLYAFLATTLSVRRPELGEWGSIWRFGIAGVLPWGVVTGVAAYAFRKGFAQRQPVHAVAIVMFALLSMNVVRLVGFFGLLTTIVVSLEPPHVQRRPVTPSPASQGFPAVISMIFFCVLTVGALVWAVRSFTCVRMTGDWRPVEGDVRYLREVVKGGRLVTWFNWGQYAIWHLAPEFKVSLDGRRETVYSERFLRRHFAFYRGERGWEKFLGDIKADAVWLPRSVPVVRLLESAGWRPVRRTEDSVIFVRPGRAFPLDTTRSHGTDACFPHP